ncbi:response regulator transcription factor [Kitasatospora sp. SUK 42]|uniref:response regulator transcription factor n=1 Tax=Kitasatospora sp. SUK 42 TaxID=1588882 RepID=UPI0018C9C439|nr:response regulator transcription factor [Kitasatospora sp. SUK 42]MBV2156646.1 response regulator transcription factor [Kitasatospora sp. SUK 42]
MTNVLVVERDVSEAEAMEHGLRRQGYTTRSVHTGAGALRAYRDADLVLLSLELGDIDGLDVCRSVRSDANTPLIAVADLDDELGRVLALRAGADDCVVRNWGFREIGARIDAVLRRSRRGTSAAKTISLRPLHIDPGRREVRLHGRLVPVTSKEFELLYALAVNPETVVSRRELMATVWDSNWACTSRTIDTHVSSLRAKLGSGRWITTVRGVGYRMGYGEGCSPEARERFEMPEAS